MAKKSIWSTPSKYGTYEGPRGNPDEWSASFNHTFANSDSVKRILGTSYYITLGLQPSASLEEIKTAYRTLAMKYHPDKYDGDDEMFVRITTAYKGILSNMETLANMPVRSNPLHQTSPANSAPRPQRAAPDELIIPQLLTEIEEIDVTSYLNNPEYGAQEKKDGRHITLQVIIDGPFLVRNKKGDTSTCAPEFEQSLRSLDRNLLIDGEHIGNKFHVWDLLEIDGVDIRELPYYSPTGASRYSLLKSLNIDDTIKIVKLAITTEEKIALYKWLKENKKEGIVFKKLTAEFTPGKGDDQFKFKFYAEASVIVVEGREGKASIGMEVIDPHTNSRIFIGYCSCNSHPAIGSIAEIKYLYAYPGGCLIQPSFKGLRDDTDPEDCTTSKLKYKSEED